VALSRRRAVRASVHDSELPAGTIRGFLFADVLADLLQFEPARGHRITAGPAVFAGEVSLLSAHTHNRDGALPLQEPDHGGDRVFGWYRYAHVHMIRHPVPFHDLAFLLLRQRVEDGSQLLASLAEDYFPSSFGNQDHMGYLQSVAFGVRIDGAITAPRPQRLAYPSGIRSRGDDGFLDLFALLAQIGVISDGRMQKRARARFGADIRVI
jgi:hypothetical protein